MSTLYELTNEYMALLEMAEDPDIDPQAFADTLEALGGELESKLVAASESGDGNAITAIAKEMDDNKNLVDSLYAEWERTSAELEAAKDKYPI